MWSIKQSQWFAVRLVSVTEISRSDEVTTFDCQATTGLSIWPSALMTNTVSLLKR
jgi:hypothetical protein